MNGLPRYKSVRISIAFVAFVGLSSGAQAVVSLTMSIDNGPPLVPVAPGAGAITTGGLISVGPFDVLFIASETADPGELCQVKLSGVFDNVDTVRHTLSVDVTSDKDCPEGVWTLTYDGSGEGLDDTELDIAAHSLSGGHNGSFISAGTHNLFTLIGTPGQVVPFVQTFTDDTAPQFLPPTTSAHLRWNVDFGPQDRMSLPNSGKLALTPITPVPTLGSLWFALLVAGILAAGLAALARRRRDAST